MANNRLKNLLLAGSLVGLTACGGGGGGAGGAISNFVEEDLSNLTGSETIINSYSSLLSGFNSTISSGNFASLSAIMTGPKDEDISKANDLLTMLNQAETLWDQTLTLIESQDADTKLSIYNSDDYKNAHAALLYLKNHVKPVIQKVSQGKKLSLTEYNKVANDQTAQQLIEQEKTDTVENYVKDKKSKIEEDKKKAEDSKKTEEKKEESKEEETKEETKEEETKEEETKEEETKEEETKEETKEEETKEETKTEEKDPWEGVADNKPYIGTTTSNYLNEASDYEDAEYQSANGLGTIKASSAYAKGWTGQNAVLGVIDTWQQTNHPDLDGQYVWYNDYVRYDNTVEKGGDQQVHGTHVAGIIASKNDGSGTQGVAFDSKLVGANIDYHGNGGISKNNAQLALHDMAELKAPVSEGGKNMNIVAVNMSINNEVSYLTDSGSYNVTQLGDGTYHAPKVIKKITDNGSGEAKYWRHATDNDIILVNSAGNSQYVGSYVPADPGLWATETDSNGDLILGGKMIIVGNWNGTTVSGNKAGHVCLSVDLANDKCNDTHKISDFYLLAPGTNINSTAPTNLDGDGYMSMSGSSMAAPHVTGAFGIIHQMWPHMKGENLAKLLLNTADKTITGYDVNVHGQGLLDLDAATMPYGTVGIPVTGRTNGKVINLTGMDFSSGGYVPSSLLNLKIMVLDEYERDYYLNIGNSFTVKDKRKYDDMDVALNGYTYLPLQQTYGNFQQGGQYDLGNLNFGLYTGENGNGDWTANIGKNFTVSDKLTFKTTVGHMNEQTTWLGNESSGALAVGKNNTTNFTQVGASYELGKGSISFDYSIGKTEVNTVANSLIKSVDDVTTESMKVGYDVNHKNKKWGASISLPSTIKSGNMHLNVPESRTIDGHVNHVDINSSLAGGKQEINYGIYYGKDKIGEMDSGFNFKAEYRQNISGVNGNDGINVGFNYIKKLNTNCKFLWMKNPKCFKKDKNGKMVMKDIYNDNETPVTATAFNNKEQQ